MTRNLRSLCGASLLVVCGVGCGGSGPSVEVVRPVTQPLAETFTEPAKTELLRTWPVRMPRAGRLKALITLRPGDSVEANAPVAVLDVRPTELALESAKSTEAEATAALKVHDDHALEQTMKLYIQRTMEATGKAVEASKAQLVAEEARLRRAREELARLKKEVEAGTASKKELLDAVLREEVAVIELRKQEFNQASMVAVLAMVSLGPRMIDDYLANKKLQRGEVMQRLTRAKVERRRAERDLGLDRAAAPVQGLVLRRSAEGTGPFPAGQDLLILGRPQDLRITAEVLTQDALRLKVGAPVELTSAGGGLRLSGAVSRVEPAGFTKRSSLGVEQQRVRVWITLKDAERPKRLGVGFRLTARFEVRTKPEALTVPRFSVLEAADGSHYVFVVDAQGALARRAVELGLRGELVLEVTKGLSASDRVVAAPDATLREGQRVRAVDKSQTRG